MIEIPIGKLVVFGLACLSIGFAFGGLTMTEIRYKRAEKEDREADEELKRRDPYLHRMVNGDEDPSLNE